MEDEQNTENFIPNAQSTPNQTGEDQPSQNIARVPSAPRVSFSDEKLESSSILDVQSYNAPDPREVAAPQRPPISEVSDPYINYKNPHPTPVSIEESSVPKSFISSSVMASTPQTSFDGGASKRQSKLDTTPLTPPSFQVMTKKLEMIDAHLKQKKDQTQTLELLVQELASLMLLAQPPVANQRQSNRKSVANSMRSVTDKKLPKILDSLCSRIIESGIEDLDFEELRYFHEEIYHAASKLVSARNPEARMLNEVANMRQQIDVLNNEIQKVRCALKCPRKNCPK